MARALRAVAVLCLALGCAAAAFVSEPWLEPQAPLGREHPLVFKLWSRASADFVVPAALVADAARADFVLLGERHDNPDQHRLQAWLVDAVSGAGRSPAVVFEMIDMDQSAALEAQRAAEPDDVDGIGRAVAWEQSGWPDWALYRPIFAAAVEHELPILAADLSRAQRNALRNGGVAGIDAAERARLALDAPLSDAAHAELAAEIRDGHCGMAPERAIGAMIDVQRARDAALSDALLRAPAAKPAVLIAGAGHVRRDRGAPLYLARRAPERRVLALVFVEVAADLDDPAKLAGDAFDYVWLTPRVDDLDPCERFKQELEKLKAAPPPS